MYLYAQQQYVLPLLTIIALPIMVPQRCILAQKYIHAQPYIVPLPYILAQPYIQLLMNILKSAATIFVSESISLDPLGSLGCS